MLVESLVETVREHSDSLAVADQRLTLSYRHLARLSSIFRRVVTRETKCERVGLMLPASAVFPAALMGTLWAGRIAIPLNFLLQPDELRKIVEDSGIDLLVSVRPFDKLTSQLPCRAAYVEDLAIKRRMFIASLLPLPSAPEVRADDTAVILYTSGTTAEPKGVELTYGNLYSNCMDCIHSLDMDPRQRFLNILPPFHVFGLTANVLLPICLGASVFSIPRFSPIAAVRAIEEHEITIMLAIPSMYAAMLRVKSATGESMRSIRIAVSGGEPLSDRVRADFEKRFGVMLHQGYGLTETSPVVSVCLPQAHKEGSVGRPIRNTSVRVVDADGCDLSGVQDGEILIRGPGVMKGYYRKPEDTRRVIDEQGWFRTGDIGHLDADGFLFITGRAKEMLIIGGENVFPREIEAVLESHDAVQQAAVIGVPNGLRGEAPVAFVIPKKDTPVTEETLRAFARQHLAGFKTPKQIIIREDLPAGPTGKILKRRLRELLSEQA